MDVETRSPGICQYVCCCSSKAGKKKKTRFVESKVNALGKIGACMEMAD